MVLELWFMTFGFPKSSFSHIQCLKKGQNCTDFTRFRSNFWKLFKNPKSYWWLSKMLQKRGFGKSKKVFKRKKLEKIFLVAVLNTNFLSKFDQICSKYQKKSYYFGESVWFSTILNRTTSGIVLSEIVLSGDPLYLWKHCC